MNDFSIVPVDIYLDSEAPPKPLQMSRVPCPGEFISISDEDAPEYVVKVLTITHYAGSDGANRGVASVHCVRVHNLTPDKVRTALAKEERAKDYGLADAG